MLPAVVACSLTNLQYLQRVFAVLIAPSSMYVFIF